ncbi:STAS domain-containing protein [bacterium]|nr:STAS domain-containing protein [bacterium]MBU1989899.1 STAS domain-containing protein [bacterium]
MLIEKENFTIYEVEELKDKFLKTLDEESVVVDMSSVKKIDMCAIQMLCSLKQSADIKEKDFSITNANSDILHALKISGCDIVLGLKYG